MNWQTNWQTNWHMETGSMVWMRHVLVALILATTALAGLGCGGPYIRSDNIYADDPGFNIEKNTEIADTTVNREVLDVLAHYRQAVVEKDFGSLKRLISKNYYDNAGTTDTTTDDYSADHLGQIFELMAQHADDIKYDVMVQDVEVNKDRAFVDYKFQYAYQYEVDGKASWDAGMDVNRLELSQMGGRWRIVSGL